MREIKFRAWDSHEKRWLTPDECEERIIINPYIKSNGKFVLDGRSKSNGMAQRLDINIELMQFTGLHDTHGQDIYEGDIVRDLDGEIGKITWFGGIWWIVYETGEDEHLWEIDVEIIGNIHEQVGRCENEMG